MDDTSGFGRLLEIIKDRDAEIERLQEANLLLVERKRRVEMRARRFEYAYESALKLIIQLKNRHLLTDRLKSEEGSNVVAVNRCVIRGGSIARTRLSQPMINSMPGPAKPTKANARYGNPKRR